MLTYQQIYENKEIMAYIERADETIRELGYTEHSMTHVGTVTRLVKYILESLDYSQRVVELGMIAAHMHDIGNMLNRTDHAQTSAIMAFTLLRGMGASTEEIAEICTAISNHDEATAIPVSPIAAALIIADKSDVRRSRVRNSLLVSVDIHDRVNYSVTDSSLTVDKVNRQITLSLSIDNKYCTVMEYFEIFLNRMNLCQKAARKLDLQFGLMINGQKMI